MTDLSRLLRRYQYPICGLFAAVVTWGLLSPQSLLNSPYSPTKLVNDIIVHCVTFTIAGFGGTLLFGNNNRRQTFLVTLSLVIFGVGTELAQAFIPLRTCSASDLFANLTGIAAGTVLAIRWQRHEIRQTAVSAHLHGNQPIVK